MPRYQYIATDEAGRTTAYAYDATGNRLTRTVTDTASGEARVTRWAYNALGGRVERFASEMERSGDQLVLFLARRVR